MNGKAPKMTERMSKKLNFKRGVSPFSTSPSNSTMKVRTLNLEFGMFEPQADVNPPNKKKP